MAATHTAQASTKGNRSKAGSKSTRKTDRAASRPADAIKLLKDDHREVKAGMVQAI